MKVATFLRALACLNAFALSRSGRVIGRPGASLRVDQSSTADIARQIKQAKNNLCGALLRDSRFTQDPTPTPPCLTPSRTVGQVGPAGHRFLTRRAGTLSFNRESVSVPPRAAL